MCFGCTFSEDIEINNKGNVVILTDRIDGNDKKYYRGNLNNVQLDSLDKLFQLLRIDSLNSIYPKILDERIFKLLIEYELNGELKNRFFTGCEINNELVFLIIYIMEIAAQTELVQVEVMHYFDTYKICDEPPVPTENMEIIPIFEGD
jgi:hypothetical protein